MHSTYLYGLENKSLMSLGLVLRPAAKLVRKSKGQPLVYC